MGKLRFTIITVCYNEEKNIEKTIQSLLDQSFENYEYIIKDGGSTDGTVGIIRKKITGRKQVVFSSEKDGGIYDAMNIAVKKAEGEYIYFLNAGDYFHDSEVLHKVDAFLTKCQTDIVYGSVIEDNGTVKRERRYGVFCRNKLYWGMGACICHQALFAKRQLFYKKFDTGLKVCADREWELYQINKGVSFVPADIEVATVLTDGYSRNHVKDMEREICICLSRYYPYLVNLYRASMFFRKNKIILQFMRYCENLLFIRKYKKDGRSIGV